jgi:hypothetical protein
VVGVVAPVDEEQALADESGQARALIEGGEFDAALDLLEGAWEQARLRGDGETLGEIGSLARAVWRRAPPGSGAEERAHRLASAIPGGRESRGLGLALAVWTAVGVLAWVVTSEALYALWASQQHDFIHWPRGAVYSMSGVIVLPIWLVGLLLVIRSRRSDGSDRRAQHRRGWAG